MVDFSFIFYYTFIIGLHSALPCISTGVHYVVENNPATNQALLYGALYGLLQYRILREAQD